MQNTCLPCHYLISRKYRGRCTCFGMLPSTWLRFAREGVPSCHNSFPSSRSSKSIYLGRRCHFRKTRRTKTCRKHRHNSLAHTSTYHARTRHCLSTSWDIVPLRSSLPRRSQGNRSTCHICMFLSHCTCSGTPQSYRMHPPENRGYKNILLRDRSLDLSTLSGISSH